jgi:hypothetical protein
MLLQRSVVLGGFGGSKFGAHEINGLLVSFDSAGFLEDGTSCNEHINTCFADLLDVVNLDTSINFKTAVQAVVVDQFSCLAGLVQSTRNESLSAESGVHRHEEDNIKLIQNVLGDFQRSGRVENKSSLATSVLDKLKGTVNVACGFGVEGNVRGTSFNEITDSSVNRGDHKMNIDRSSNAVISKSLANQGSDGQIWDIVVVHNVEVNDIGSSLQDIVNFGTQLSEVSRKDGRSNQIFFISPNIQRSDMTGILWLKSRI